MEHRAEGGGDGGYHLEQGRSKETLLYIGVPSTSSRTSASTPGALAAAPSTVAGRCLSNTIVREELNVLGGDEKPGLFCPLR